MKITVITLSSILGIIYLFWSVYHKFRIGFDHNEFSGFFLDLVLILPAILGLFFYSGKNFVSKSVKTVYWIYLMIQILVFVLILTTKDALELGIPMLLIVFPITAFLSIILIIQIIRQQIQ